MQNIFALLLAIITTQTMQAQNSLKLLLLDNDTKAPIEAVNIKWKKTGTISNMDGLAELKNIPDGLHSIHISHSGYEAIIIRYQFPIKDNDRITIFMETEKEELEEVIVQSTRTSRTIKNTATRIETIDGEELDEKNNMRPANVSMLLHESTGLQVQQTSATSGNASIRVQGLDGRYTQLLKDGYPNFGNFASGLSILEIPPLDLKQVEVIKGPASTLYGAGAIAGVINFISKTPTEGLNADFLINQSNIGQRNLGTYISQKKGRLGFTLLGLLNTQESYDVDKDDFSELPESNNFTINPRIFFYINPSVTLTIGNSFTKGSNTGGDMQVIDKKPDLNHTYFEKNKTIRNTSILEFDKKLGENNSIKLKQSLSIFNRELSTPGYLFDGRNTNSFTDLSYAFVEKKHQLITGINLVYDRFKQEQQNNLDASSFTTGVYIQDSWDISDAFKIEAGTRVDHVNYSNNNYKKTAVFILPRASVLYRISNKLSTRFGGGLGYKIPGSFTEQTEGMQYKNLLALNNVSPERSVGATADLNYSTAFFEDLHFSINQLFFYTNIRKPLVLQQDILGDYYFSNSAKPVISKGFETNIKFIYKEDLKLFVGYTFTDARATYKSANSFLALLPKNKLNLTMMYEKEDNFKLGLEGYFTDRQYLNNGFKTPSFWEFGFMAQKTFNKISLFINFENFTDQRQSNFKTVVNLPHNNPTFDDIWNHTEGFVMNGGLKIKL